MEMTLRELWTAIHGMAMGAPFLLLFTGAFIAIADLGNYSQAPELGRKPLLRATLITSAMALAAWATVILGTYWVYPWYRAKAPEGANLAGYPKYLLLSKPQTTEWHEFGMEWKEHIAWLVPILATAVAFLVARQGQQLITDKRLRRTALFLFTIAFIGASVAGGLGALINKAAPTR